MRSSRASSGSRPQRYIPGLQQAYERIRPRASEGPARTSSGSAAALRIPAHRRPGPRPPLEIHIIDVKMAAEPALRRFTEVTFYGLARRRARARGAFRSLRSSAEGFIWPGSHDANAFRNLFRDGFERGDPDPLTSALCDAPDGPLRSLSGSRAPVLRGPTASRPRARTARCGMARGPEVPDLRIPPLLHEPGPIRGPPLPHPLGEPRPGAAAQVARHLHDPRRSRRRSRAVLHRGTTRRSRATSSSPEVPALLALRPGRLQLVRRSPWPVGGCDVPVLVEPEHLSLIDFDPGSGVTFAMGAKRVQTVWLRAWHVHAASGSWVGVLLRI